MGRTGLRVLCRGPPAAVKQVRSVLLVHTRIRNGLTVSSSTDFSLYHHDIAPHPHLGISQSASTRSTLKVQGRELAWERTVS